MRIFGWISLLVFMVFCSCGKNEISLKFELPDNVNSTYRIIYYASDKKQGMIRETAVSITNGKGEINLPMVNPSLIYIFSSSHREPDLVFYGNRGDKMVITGSSDDIRNWQVAGNKISEEWTKWRAENRKVLEGRGESDVNRAVAAYVEKHPDSDLSLVLLALYYSRRLDPAGFHKLYSGLSKDVVNNSELVSVISAGDLLEGQPLRPTVPGKLILIGESGYADTLNLKDSKPSLLMFVGRDGYGNTIGENLKTLTGEGKGIIAEFYTDSDSLNWRGHMRADSIPGMKRYFMPLGIVDTVAMTLGVDRIPYYVAIGEKGNIRYSGSDWDKAVASFKK